MHEGNSADRNTTPLWEYVYPSEHRVPSPPVEHAVRTGLAAMWLHLRPAAVETDERFRDETGVEDLSAAQLEQLAPAPGWDDAVAALDVALESWLARPGPDPPAVLVVGQPHSGNPDILRRWADRQGWRVPRMPEPAEILGGGLDWVDDVVGDGSDCVIPTLERCYLRHVHGLQLVRHLLERLWNGAHGRTLIGCDSWAWAYLRNVWHGQVPPTLIAQAFDGDRLAAWLAGPDLPGRMATVFRQANDGRYLWQPRVATAEVPTTDFLRYLAADARGIPGVAQAWWRRSLLGTARQLTAQAGIQTEAGVRTVLVRPWNQLKGMTVPAGNGIRESGLVLHALLLHGGLPLAVAHYVVPLAEQDVRQAVSRLEAADLVAIEDGRCQVTAAGYPAVRKVVAALGYLTD